MCKNSCPVSESSHAQSLLKNSSVIKQHLYRFRNQFDVLLLKKETHQVHIYNSTCNIIVVVTKEWQEQKKVFSNLDSSYLRNPYGIADTRQILQTT